jgi:glutamine phosphoribosylpyrophosphate amidotransferase
MCGIAGILKFDGNSITESELKRFTNSLYHRGPDAAGFFINEKNLASNKKKNKRCISFFPIVFILLNIKKIIFINHKG